MKKLLAMLLTLALLVSLVAGCGAAKPEAEAPTGDDAETPAAETIKIGYVSALSGDTALWGQAGLNGMQLTAEKVNAAGGVLGQQIEVIGLDGKGEPLDSVNAYNKLVDEYNVCAVVGTNFSSCNIAIAPVATEKKVSIIGTAASNELVTVDEAGNLHPYSFRLCFIDSFQGKVLAKYAFEKLEAKKAAMIFDIGDAYSSGIAGVIEEAYAEIGGEMLTSQEMRSGDNDYRAQLTKIIATNPEIIFVPLIYKDVALIATQARELGYEGIFIGADGWDSLELPALAAGALEGSVYCSRPGFSTPEAQAYGEEYQAKFNVGLEGECLFGNDALLWVCQVIEEAGSADPEAIRDGLENTTHFSGLIGEMSVDPATHNPTREAAMFKIEGEGLTLVEMYTIL